MIENSIMKDKIKWAFLQKGGADVNYPACIYLL